MANLKRPELNLTGNITENFKNFEMRFNDYCIQASYRDLTKDPAKADEIQAHYNKSQLEIAALRSAVPDEALQVIRYTIEPQIEAADKHKPWIWMAKLRDHYVGSTGSSRLSDRFTYWLLAQKPNENIQDWEVRVRQGCALCSYQAQADEMSRDKFIFGLNCENIRTELLKTHLNSDKTEKSMRDVVTEAKALETSMRTSKMIGESQMHEAINWTSHKNTHLRREPGTCFWCGDIRGPHAWHQCPANGQTCAKCGGNDHFARVCLENPDMRGRGQQNDYRGKSRPYQRGRGRSSFGMRGRGETSRGRGDNYRGGSLRPSNFSRGRGTQSQRETHQLEGVNHEYDEQYKYDEQYNEYSGNQGDQYEQYNEYSGNEGDQHEVYSLQSENKKQSVHEIVVQNKGKKYFAHIPVSEDGNHFAHIQFQIDSAATCNTIGAAALKASIPNATLSASPFVLYPYGNSKPINPQGQIALFCQLEDRLEETTFQVLSEDVMSGKPALLSGVDSERLGLIKFNYDEAFAISSELLVTQDKRGDTLPSYQISAKGCETQYDTKACQPVSIPPTRRLPPPGKLTRKDILREYSTNFEGIGLMGPPVRFKLRENHIPVQMPVHRVPIAKREKEKIALDHYEKAGIITKVRDPTPWCSNELIRETPKKFRVCIDPSQTVNKALMRPVYQMPILNEQLHKLSHAKCFSLLDVREGFLHCPLDEESSYMTTMHTSFGRYRWLRLPFGISSAPEEFQMRLATALEGLGGTVCVADDILVYGSGNTIEEASIDHDRRLVALLERCYQRNIRLNMEKLQFKLGEVKFMGHIISGEGMRPDPDKVAAITQMETPRDKAGLLRFIGMANYLSPFCDNLSSVIQPLRMLTREGAAFLWSDSQELAFRNAKKLIARTPTLRYYDINKPVTLQVDASESGLGGTLLQPNENGKLQPVAFTSCSLNPTEQRYSQIEKECLAICQAFQKFDQWLYGKKDITVHTDHKPLETILMKSLNKAPARLQKMMMRLQRYEFAITYKKGTSLYIADTLSRAALPVPVVASVTGFEVFRLEVETLFYEPNPNLSPESRARIAQETQKDTVLQRLYPTITEGWPADKSQLEHTLRPYWTFRDELSVQNGTIYKGHQVLVPSTLQTEMLRKIHSAHQGAESCLRMAREVLFWLGMRQAIQDLCDSCSACAKYGKCLQREPMKSLPIPSLPWQIVSQDLFAYHGKSYLVTVCHFSDWIEMDELSDTLSATVIKRTKCHFARYGVPKVCHTDNGPQFISGDYKSFSEQYAFHHSTSSPYHSQGNGRAEAAVKLCKSLLKRCDDVEEGLLIYRNTPQQGHSYSPAQRMFSRRTRTTLPTSDDLLTPQTINVQVVEKEIRTKRQLSKSQYDKHAGRPHENLAIGSHVYAKPPPHRREDPWTYGEIVKNNRQSSYTIQTPSGEIGRNSSHLRPAAPPTRYDYNAQPQRPVLVTVQRTPVEAVNTSSRSLTSTSDTPQHTSTAKEDPSIDTTTTTGATQTHKVPILGPTSPPPSRHTRTRVIRAPKRFRDDQ